MLKWIRRFRSNEKGATAIEFAMVAPVLFFMIFGVVEFGLLMATQGTLEGAVSKAARVYKAEARSDTTGANASQIKGLVAQYSSGLIKRSWLKVTVRRINSWGGSQGAGGGPTQNEINNTASGRTGRIMQYRAYYNYRVYTPFLSRVMGGNDGIIPIFVSTVVQNEPAVDSSSGL